MITDWQTVVILVALILTCPWWIPWAFVGLGILLGIIILGLFFAAIWIAETISTLWFGARLAVKHYRETL